MTTKTTIAPEQKISPRIIKKAKLVDVNLGLSGINFNCYPIMLVY